MAAHDLCSVADVRSLMQVDAGDVEQDLIIQTLISAASRAISRYCEQEFAPATSSVARTFEFTAESLFVDLAPYSLRAVSQVRVDTDLTATVVDPQFYRLYPQPAPLGVYTALRLFPFGPSGWQKWRKRLVEITGDWGFASVPEDVSLAAQITVMTWLRRDVSAFSTVFNIDEGRLERPEALPSAVRGMLASGGFKREVYS